MYRDAFDDMIRRATGQSVKDRETIYPNVYDGVEGVCFVQLCLASHRDNGSWKPFPQAW